MAVPKQRLGELHQRVVLNELGLAATIEENGDVLLEHPELDCFSFPSTPNRARSP